MNPSTQDYTKARAEQAQGMGAGMMDKAKAAATDLKAGVKETLGYDATADRLEAERLRAQGAATQTTHDAKSTAHDVKGKVEEKLGH